MPRPEIIDTSLDLAAATTLGVGGRADYVSEPIDDAELGEALNWAREQELPVLVLGGGSNVLVNDEPFEGLVIRSADYRMNVEREDGVAYLQVGAGVEWDELVAFAVDERFAGIECLSGIPGRVGAAPIQNIGAYGQEVSDTIVSVDVMDRETCARTRLSAEECGFGYRTSRFKREWRDRYIVRAVTFGLTIGGAPTLRYPELQAHVAARSGSHSPSLSVTREAVLDIRAKKSMVLRSSDPNRRSAGSFFTNPIVTADLADDVEAIAEGRDLGKVPRYPAGEGLAKLSAAWLIERSGFERGFAFGRVGFSTRHCLALVNRGGASARDVLSLASIVRRTVCEGFGVVLEPEPVFVNFDASIEELLR